MPFKKTFEKNLNRHMQQQGHQQQDAGSSSHSHASDLDDTDIKTPYIHDSSPDDDDEGIEYENEKAHHTDSKKDAPPPRFSTIYGPSSTVHPQMPHHDDYTTQPPPPPRKKSGIWLPWSLFILLSTILFLESTVLFTYTIIGLYNNTPSRVFAWAGVGDAYTPCMPQPETKQQPAVNFAPNIVIPQPQPVMQPAPAAPLMITVSDVVTSLVTTSVSYTTTTTQTEMATSTVTTTATVTNMPQDLMDEMISRLFASSPSTPSGNTVSSIEDAGSLASEIASLLKPSSAGTGLAVTETATVPPSTAAQSTSTAVVVVTVNPSGQTISGSASSTGTVGLPSIVAKDTTSTVSASHSEAASVPSSSKEESSVTKTTLSTEKASATKSVNVPSASTDATESQGFCFGAGGATELICEPGSN